MPNNLSSATDPAAQQKLLALMEQEMQLKAQEREHAFHFKSQENSQKMQMAQQKMQIEQQKADREESKRQHESGMAQQQKLQESAQAHEASEHQKYQQFLASQQQSEIAANEKMAKKAKDHADALARMNMELLLNQDEISRKQATSAIEMKRKDGLENEARLAEARYEHKMMMGAERETLVKGISDLATAMQATTDLLDHTASETLYEADNLFMTLSPYDKKLVKGREPSGFRERAFDAVFGPWLNNDPNAKLDANNEYAFRQALEPADAATRLVGALAPGLAAKLGMDATQIQEFMEAAIRLTANPAGSGIGPNDGSGGVQGAQSSAGLQGDAALIEQMLQQNPQLQGVVEGLASRSDTEYAKHKAVTKTKKVDRGPGSTPGNEEAYEVAYEGALGLLRNLDNALEAHVPHAKQRPKDILAVAERSLATITKDMEPEQIRGLLTSLPPELLKKFAKGDDSEKTARRIADLEKQGKMIELDAELKSIQETGTLRQAGGQRMLDELDAMRKGD